MCNVNNNLRELIGGQHSRVGSYHNQVGKEGQKHFWRLKGLERLLHVMLVIRSNQEYVRILSA